jgi:hypothetical protein
MSAVLRAWKAGVIPVGATSVELPHTPQVVIFLGANFGTENAINVADGTGLFRGYVAERGGQMSYSAIPAYGANGYDAKAIACLAAGGGWAYSASVSIRENGFDLSNALPRKVAYLAGWGFPAAYGFPLITKTATVDIGFRPYSALAMGGRLEGGPPSSNFQHSTSVWGSGNHEYTGSSLGGPWWGHAGIECHNFPDSTSGQYELNRRTFAKFNGLDLHFGDSATFPSFAMSTAGFSGGLVSGAGTYDYRAGCGADFFTGGCVVWAGKSRTGSLTPIATPGLIASVTDLEIRPDAVLFYSLSDEPTGQNNYGNSGIRPGALSFGLATPDFSYCVAIDGRPRCAFQSFTRSVVVVAGSGAVTTADVSSWYPAGFDLTTFAAGAGTAIVSWHALGPPRVWVPQMYRVPRIGRSS